MNAPFGRALTGPPDERLFVDRTMADLTAQIVEQRAWPVTPSRSIIPIRNRGLPSGWTITRASPAWRERSNGLWEELPANVLRNAWVNGVYRGWFIDGGSAANDIRMNRDLTDAVWTKTNATAARTTGIDGVTNSASSLTATAANATCLQAITAASAVRCTSAFIKRLTGSGTINMTTDGGTTWGTIAPTASWARYTIPVQTLANPNIGFRIVTSGDAIAVDLAQSEQNFWSSPITNTSNANNVTRLIETLSIPLNPAWFTESEGALYIEGYQAILQTGQAQGILSVDNALTTERHTLGIAAANGSSFISVDNNSTQASILSTTWTAGAQFRMAAGWKLNDFALSVNGAAAVTDVAGTICTPIRMVIGHAGAATTPYFGFVSHLALFNVRPTNAQLAIISA